MRLRYTSTERGKGLRLGPHGFHASEAVVAQLCPDRPSWAGLSGARPEEWCANEPFSPPRLGSRKLSARVRNEPQNGLAERFIGRADMRDGGSVIVTG